MIKRKSSLVIVLFFSCVAFAQKQDTLYFTEQSFLKQLVEYAPFVKNASLYANIEALQYQESRAAFEPKFGSTYDYKKFEDKTYYDKLETGVKVNTPLGIKLNGGYLNNAGTYLNPENNLPTQGLAFAGFEIPLGAGLFTDADRFNVRQQKLEMDAASLVNKLQVNQYMYDAATAYWEWFGASLNLSLASDALQKVESRYLFVKSRYNIGEAAAVDTLEAYINLQNRRAYMLDVQVKWYKQNAYLRNFIWLPNFENGKVASTADFNYEIDFTDSLLTAQLVSEHPIVQLIETDSLINFAAIRLAKEYYKPQVDLAFKFQEDAGNFGDFNYSIDRNQYVGLNVYMPLFLRKERAKAKQLETKQAILSNKKIETIVKLNNDIDIAKSNTTTLQQSVFLWQNITENYNQLLAAEQAKFTLGESSLFILNNREVNWIESREKYIKNYVEYRLQALRYYYTLVLLPEL